MPQGKTEAAMKRICAWCRKNLSGEEDDSGSDRVITHGICDQCQNNLWFQQGVPFHQFIDSLEEPVLVVDSEDRIENANRKARKLLGKELDDIKGAKRGEVFECAYARLPEGCGKTRHCSGCAIRRTVGHTLESGKSFLRVPATLRCEGPKGDKGTRFLISTEKVGDVVLLRIDDVDRKRKGQLGIADDKK
jgi:PAS domain-containing protein